MFEKNFLFSFILLHVALVHNKVSLGSVLCMFKKLTSLNVLHVVTVRFLVCTTSVLFVVTPFLSSAVI